MATAVKQPSPPAGGGHSKPSIPPKPPGLASAKPEKETARGPRREKPVSSPSEPPPPPPIAQSTQAQSSQLMQAALVAEKARSVTREDTSAGETSRSKPGTSAQPKQTSGAQVKRSHSTAVESSLNGQKGVKIKRHSSVREGKELAIEKQQDIIPDDDLEKNKSRVPVRRKLSNQDDDFQSRMKDCLWTPLASFVVKTKAGGAALVEKGSKKLFGRGLPPRKKTKKPAPPPPENGHDVTNIRSRPQVPPRPLLKLLLAGIDRKEQGVWHKLDHVKYIDEEVSTEDSTDYNDVDWGKALSTDSKDEDIIYYTYIEETPNEKVVFYQRLSPSQNYSSGEEQDVVLEDKIPCIHVAEMENMEVETEVQKPKLSERDIATDTSLRTSTPVQTDSATLNLSDSFPSEDARRSPQDDRSEGSVKVVIESFVNGDSRIVLNGDENANHVVASAEVTDDIPELIHPDEIADGTSETSDFNVKPRRKSPQYAYVQKVPAQDQLVAVDDKVPVINLNEGYYDLDVQIVRPKIKPKRPPLPRKPPSRPAPPVPPKTYMSLRFPPRQKEEKGAAEDKEMVIEAKIVEDISALPDSNVTVIEAEVLAAEMGENLEPAPASESRPEFDLKDETMQSIDLNADPILEASAPERDMDITISLEDDQGRDIEAISVVTESIAETMHDDFSERHSRWADSEASFDKRFQYWDFRSVSVPPSITSESGFISSPTPPPRHRKLRHHSVEGVMQSNNKHYDEAESRRSKSCSDAEVSERNLGSPSSQLSNGNGIKDAATNTIPQRPPRPPLKPKPERPPKPIPASVKKLVPVTVHVDETCSVGDPDAISFTSSEDSPKLIRRMKTRPLPAPPAPPRQRSPRPVKRLIPPQEIVTPPQEIVTPPTPEKEPEDPAASARPIASSFPAEFLNRLSEIEAGRLNVSEIRVHKIQVTEIDASIIRVGGLEVGKLTPLTLLGKMKLNEEDESLIDSKVPSTINLSEVELDANKTFEYIGIPSEVLKKEDEKDKSKEEEEEKQEEDKQKDSEKEKYDDKDKDKKDKKDKDDKGGNGGQGNNEKKDDDNDNNNYKDDNDDSQPPDWWKESVPPSDGTHQDNSNSVMTGNIKGAEGLMESTVRLSKSPSPAKLKIIDRLIITPLSVLPGGKSSSKFYLNDNEEKSRSQSPTPSQKSTSSCSSREDKKEGSRKCGRSSWYDEDGVSGHTGDVDTSDGWISGRSHHKRLSLPEEKETQNLVDSDVEGVSQIRQQIASLFQSVGSQERRKGSQFSMKEDSHSSSSTTDAEQEDPKHGARPNVPFHRHRSLSSGSARNSPREVKPEPEWPKLDPNANYCEPIMGLNEEIGIEAESEKHSKSDMKMNSLPIFTDPANPNVVKSMTNSVCDNALPVVKRNKLLDTSSSTSVPNDPSKRLTSTSLMSIPTSEESWCNCESGDESDTESSSFLTSQSCFEDQNTSDAAEHREAKKFYIAKEMMTSEKVFVDVLKLLNEDFREIVMEANNKNGHKIIPEAIFNHVLRYLPQLQNLNEDLLRDLTERIEKWDDIGRIADVIVKKGPFLKLYSSYIKDFESMTSALDEACKKYPGFAQVVKDFEMSERCQRLAIRHYMLKPVQRIPQYKLLLEDYLKHLRPDSADYQDTITALSIVSDVANHANQTMKQGDNFSKLLQIQNSLVGNYEIIKPGRIFLKEGELFKLSRKIMQPRWFILFNDSLLHTDMVQQGSYRLHHDLPLVGTRVMLPTNEEHQNEFSIISVARSFTLSASSPQVRDEWIVALNQAIDANAARRGTFTNAVDKQQKDPSSESIPFSLGKQAPVWIPDGRVTMCQLCTCEFTVTFRRHHCRACGKVVCANCSANRAPLQYLKFQSVRVCNECFEILTEEFEASENTVNESDGSTECGGSDRPNDDTNSQKLKLDLKAQFKRYAISNGRKGKRYLPKVLKEVSANHQGATHSGYLQKRVKKSWRKLWFVIHDKVLYTYKASEDIAALESIPLLGFQVQPCPDGFENIDPKFTFQLYHPGHASMIFYAESEAAVEKWTKAMESATVLE